MTALPDIRPIDVPRLHRELAGAAAVLARTIPHGGGRDAEFARAAVAALHDRRQFADLFLATREMTRVAVDAARDVPPMLATEAQPSFDGAVFFSGGLPEVDLLDRGVGLHPEALTWTRAEGVPVISLWARDKPMGGAWVPACTVEIIDPHLPTDPDSFENPRYASAAALALATWHLMAMPTLAQQREVGPPGAKGRGAPRRDIDRRVKVVDLRRLARDATSEGSTDPKGRIYRHRWIVRGHWRQQPVGEGQKGRRTQWVESHIKGPPGAPLLGSETVFVWRR